MHTLILGGARSGKSAFAEQLFPTDCVYVATARPWRGEFDADFQQRIALHQQRRPSNWYTEDTYDLLEVLNRRNGNPADPASGITQAPVGYGETAPLLIDDLGTWLTARIDQAECWDNPHNFSASLATELVAALQHNRDRTIVLVSPEVGMGVIPEHPTARAFRDCLGSLNAAVAAVCDQVQLVIAGQPLQIKPQPQHADCLGSS